MAHVPWLWHIMLCYVHMAFMPLLVQTSHTHPVAAFHCFSHVDYTVAASSMIQIGCSFECWAYLCMRPLSVSLKPKKKRIKGE